VINVSQWWDGGAHPDGGMAIVMYDMNQNKEIRLENIVDVGGVNNRISQLLNMVPSELAKLKQLTRESRGECNYMEPGLLHAAGISCSGVCLGAYFVRVFRTCDDECAAVLPFSLLKRNGLLRPEYGYLAK
jgi:hypothetical protein